MNHTAEQIKTRVLSRKYGQIRVFPGKAMRNAGNSVFYASDANATPGSAAKNFAEWIDLYADDGMYTAYLISDPKGRVTSAEMIFFSVGDPEEDQAMAIVQGYSEHEVSKRIADEIAKYEAQRRIKEDQEELERLRDGSNRLASAFENALLSILSRFSPGAAPGTAPNYNPPVNGQRPQNHNSMPQNLDEAFDVFEELFSESELITMAQKLKNDPTTLQMVKNFLR